MEKERDKMRAERRRVVERSKRDKAQVKLWRVMGGAEDGSRVRRPRRGLILREGGLWRVVKGVKDGSWLRRPRHEVIVRRGVTLHERSNTAK